MSNKSHSKSKNHKNSHNNQNNQQKQQNKHNELQFQESFVEENHWKDVMRTFLHYYDFLNMDIQRRKQHLSRLSMQQTARLPAITFSKLDGK